MDEIKIVRAVRLSANRTHKVLTEVEEKLIVKATMNDLFTRGFKDLVKVDDIHLSVENVLWTLDKDLYSEYRSYNNYKKRFNHSFNNILKNAKNIVYEGDKENANKDSCLNSTKMTLTSELAGKEMYLEYELPKHLSEAHKNMDFYIHDVGHRFYNMINCCLLDVANIYKDGYNLNGEFIKEPKTIEVALDQLIDIILIASSQQYGGLTIPEIDNLLEPYAQKSFNILMEKYKGDKEKSLNKLYDIMFRCFKRIQFKIKCVINAGGQTAFVTWTFGTNTSELGNLIVKAILDVRKQYMAVFPKLIYLYHSDISGEGDGSTVDFDEIKIVRAVRLSANRTHKVLTDVEEKLIVKATINDLFTRGFKDLVKVDDIHLSVENVLWTLDRDLYSEYRSYNNYKKRFNHSFNNILKNAKNIVYEGDKENANKDSCLNSTKMTLTSELAGKEMYLEYELPKHLSEAHKNMDFYIHDTGHRFYNMVNCCLLDVANIYKDGYNLNGEFIKEPKTIEVALDQLIDIILIASSQQYGK